MTMSVHMARLLVLAVIFVNGWTDAPGAIATAVGSRAISFRRGVWMAAACNLIGAAAACVCFPAVAEAALTALLHGVQDGQKFLALLLLTEGLGGEQGLSRLSLALLTAAVMALGTALGGKPIVEKMGTELAAPSPAEGLAADLGAGAVLLACSALGLPVSTTHAKVAAICGAGRGADRLVMGQMAGAWVLTFPACGGLAFLLTRLMMG